ncbi:MAG: hypothetical protein JWP25_7583 [Bradyrhizobium sp.]|nr:hypothetical protein [Bradyrhizobium sp.]
MKIAVIAWGSLIWDRRNLEVTGDFVANGPRLSLEFSRTSRDGRLTLVIDEERGGLCPTFSVQSAFDDLNKAIDNLRLREGMPTTKGVGFIDLQSGRVSPTALQRHPQAVQTIKAWAGALGYGGAIWTALASNFRESEKTDQPFSLEAGIRYLEARDDPTLAAALNYIRQAPAEVRTPFRTAVNKRWPQT